MSLLTWLIALLLLLFSPLGVPGSGATSHAGQANGSGAIPAPATVTLDDNGRILTLSVGGRFLLALGEGAWTVHLSDPSVIARVPNITVVRGAQGIYVAKRPGRSTLDASEAASPLFSVTIVVT